MLLTASSATTANATTVSKSTLRLGDASNRLTGGSSGGGGASAGQFAEGLAGLIRRHAQLGHSGFAEVGVRVLAELQLLTAGVEPGGSDAEAASVELVRDTSHFAVIAAFDRAANLSHARLLLLVERVDQFLELLGREGISDLLDPGSVQYAVCSLRTVG